MTPSGLTGLGCEVNPDDCAGHECQNGGTCQDGLSTYTCRCPEAWTGESCKPGPWHLRPRWSAPASPPHRTPSSSLCPLPTLPPAGWDCSEDVDECETQGPLHCRNGGTCQNSAGSFHCVCVSGWGGTGCEENLDDCAAATCAPGSTCIDRVGSFSCLCPPGRTGVPEGVGVGGRDDERERHQQGSWGSCGPESLTPTLPSRTPVPHGGHVPEPAVPRGSPVQHQPPDRLHTLPLSTWLLRAHLPPGPG